jgi:hypothetical protein
MIDRPRTTATPAERNLHRHGLTPAELHRLAEAAANSGLQRMNPPPAIDASEREDLISTLVEHGLRWAAVYDINQDPKRNFATSVYSRMRLRVIDWCRTSIHDPRFGTDKRQTPLEPNAVELRNRSPWPNDPTFDELKAGIAWQLTPIRRWTLDHLAGHISDGISTAAASHKAGIPVELAQALLEDLHHALKEPA